VPKNGEKNHKKYTIQCILITKKIQLDCVIRLTVIFANLFSFCDAMQYNTIQYNTIQYNTLQYNTLQYNSIQYNVIQCNLIALSD